MMSFSSRDIFGIFRKARRATKPTTLRHRLSVDRLESREVLSTAAMVGSHLMITGTPNSDSIQIIQDKSGETAFVQENSRTIGNFELKSLTLIEFHGGAGNDKIVVSDQINVPTFLNGDAGDDSMMAGLGAAIMIGGDGNDVLIGGVSRDILIGGNGGDTLKGGAGDDILIGGRHRFEENANFLFTMQNAWNSKESYTTRVEALRLGVDGFPELGLTNVYYDGSFDYLEGGAGQDWYFAGPNTKVGDQSKAESVN